MDLQNVVMAPKQPTCLQMVLATHLVPGACIITAASSHHGTVPMGAGGLCTSYRYACFPCC